MYDTHKGKKVVELIFAIVLQFQTLIKGGCITFFKYENEASTIFAIRS